MKIALFVTCLGDTLFPETGEAVVRLLERLGHEVSFPVEQTCCGQLHFNSGYATTAASLARRWLEAFALCDAVVCPSASCTAMVRNHYRELARRSGDRRLAEEVEDIAPRLQELSELLVDRLNVVDVGARFAHRVTYHSACHGLRSLELGERPLRLLRAVAGIEVLELSRADSCCGFGGTFAVKNAAVSSAMLGDKLDAVVASGAEFCVATDSSCLMHIDGGLRRRRAPVRTLHLASVLASEEAADG